MEQIVNMVETLTDKELHLLDAIARRKHGFPVEFEPHLKPESEAAFKALVKRALLERSGNTYFVTPRGHVLLEGAIL
jgi:hypothetical protein